MLYAFGGYSVDIAQAYWVRKRSRKKLPPLEPVDTKAYIEELYLATDDIAIWECAESNTSAHKFARKQAYVWHTKWKLKEYVRNSNVLKGVAPSSRIIARRYNQLLDDVPFGIRPRALDDPADAVSARVFLYRWRQSHRSKWGRIRVEDYVPLAEKQAKASSSSTPGFVIYKFWTRFNFKSGQKQNVNPAPKIEPISGPRF